jgi:hypothetical protein
MQQTSIGIVQRNTALQQQGLYASSNFKQGAVLINFSARETLSEPTYLTVQVNDAEHILLAPKYIEYINHSCNPNVFFNTATMQLEALKDIAIGEELTFFYPSTEWKMDQSFICSCRSSNCLKEIQGAYYMHKEVLKNYRLTDFILNKLQQQVRKTA